MVFSYSSKAALRTDRHFEEEEEVVRVLLWGDMGLIGDKRFGRKTMRAEEEVTEVKVQVHCLAVICARVDVPILVGRQFSVGYARLGPLPTAQVLHWLHRLCGESQSCAIISFVHPTQYSNARRIILSGSADSHDFQDDFKPCSGRSSAGASRTYVSCVLLQRCTEFEFTIPFLRVDV